MTSVKIICSINIDGTGVIYVGCSFNGDYLLTLLKVGKIFTSLHLLGTQLDDNDLAKSKARMALTGTQIFFIISEFISSGTVTDDSLILLILLGIPLGVIKMAGIGSEITDGEEREGFISVSLVNTEEKA